MEPERNPEEKTPQKVFIVVGAAGVGKSSFVKMLVKEA